MRNVANSSYTMSFYATVIRLRVPNSNISFGDMAA